MGERPVRKIIHIDMDAFYASVEQRDDPALRGKPVAVGGREARRGRRRELRGAQVRRALGDAVGDGQAPLPELVFVKPRFDVYKEVSRQIREIFPDYTPLVEPLSLDEAYLDVTDNLKGMPLASDIAREIRARILERTGLTASAGISYNKFLAKLASDHRKPNGQTVIPPERAGLRRGAAGREVPWRRPEDRGEDERARHPYRRRPASAVAGIPGAVFRQGGHLYFAIARGQDDRRSCPTGRASRSARRRPSGGSATGRDRAGVPRCSTMSGPTASAPAFSRPHRDGEDQVCRFPDRHPQPDAGNGGRNQGEAA